jgi:hypothetical protein
MQKNADADLPYETTKSMFDAMSGTEEDKKDMSDDEIDAQVNFVEKQTSKL